MLLSEAYDVVVIGAGAGGMTAAAVAAAEGLSVLLIEKTEFIGGTTAWSGGMVWIPVNARMKQAGIDDSQADAADYLASTVPETENADLRDAFLARGPEAVEYLEADTEVRLQPVKTYPDYYPDKPGATAGGRVLEPVTFDGARLGANFGRLRPPLPEFTLFGGMMVNRLDIPHLRKFGRSFRSTLRSMRLVSEYALQRLRARCRPSRAVLSRRRGRGVRRGSRGKRRWPACRDCRGREHEYARCKPCLLGAGVAFSARGRQPGRFPAYGDRPGQARRHCGQCVGKALRQRSVVVPRVCPCHAARR